MPFEHEHITWLENGDILVRDLITGKVTRLSHAALRAYGEHNLALRGPSANSTRLVAPFGYREFVEIFNDSTRCEYRLAEADPLDGTVTIHGQSPPMAALAPARGPVLPPEVQHRLSLYADASDMALERQVNYHRKSRAEKAARLAKKEEKEADLLRNARELELRATKRARTDDDVPNARDKEGASKLKKTSGSGTRTTVNLSKTSSGTSKSSAAGSSKGASGSGSKSSGGPASGNDSMDTA